MKIFDCFNFSHELDLLEIRLNYLDEVVDYFVLAESEQTFTGLKKELIFLKNKERFKKFLPKIRHVIIPPVLNLPTINDYADNTPCTSCWQREHWQMNYYFNAINDAAPTDILLINPIDEIPRLEILKNNISKTTTPKCCVQDLFFYKLNLMAVNNEKTHQLLINDPEHRRKRGRLNNVIVKYYKWYGTIISQSQYIYNNFWPHQHHQRYFMDIIEDAGWHYTYVGKEKDILTKIKSFSHADYFRDSQADNIEAINKAIENQTEIIPADRELKKIELNEQNCPTYILQNYSKYQHLILK